MTTTMLVSMHRYPRSLGVLALAVLAAGCGDALGPDASLESQDGRLVVRNDALVNRQRVTLRSAPLMVMSVTGAEAAAAPVAGGRREFSLTLVAEVAPPEVDGVTLQASHAVIRNDRAYVAYNVQGALRRGGVDVFDVGDLDDIALLSEALLLDADVGAVDLYQGSRLMLATSSDDPGFSTPAVLEVISLKNGRLTAESERVDLPSYAGTGVRVDGKTIYVTSGTGGDPVGGLSVFDRPSLALVAFDPFEDARDVDVNEGRVVAMRGTPGTVRVYDPDSHRLVATAEGGGAMRPESKSSVFVAGGCAYYAAGEDGLRVVNLVSGATVTTIPVPAVDGVAPDDAVTNGVSWDDDLVFLANGGAGLFVAQARDDLDKADNGRSGVGGCTADGLGLELVGQVRFPDGASANYVTSRNNLLFVANGMGGLSVVRINR